MEKDAMKTLLWKLGANYSYAGFDFVLEAVEMLKEDRKALQYITKELYLPIALKYNTTEKCVERNIRTIIKTVWEYGNRELLDEIAGRKLKEKPNNRDFLASLVWYSELHDSEKDQEESES